MTKDEKKQYNADYSRRYYHQHREQINAYRQRTQAKRSAKMREWRAANKQKIKNDSAKYYRKNKEKFAARRIAWNEKNKERVTEYFRSWTLANKDKVNSKMAKRRALKFRAIPRWIDRDACDKLYEEAATLTRSTGIQHHVDHIVPLNSPIVWGMWEFPYPNGNGGRL